MLYVIFVTNFFYLTIKIKLDLNFKTCYRERSVLSERLQAKTTQGTGGMSDSKAPVCSTHKEP